jgi:hypothetical protein
MTGLSGASDGKWAADNNSMIYDRLRCLTYTTSIEADTNNHAIFRESREASVVEYGFVVFFSPYYSPKFQYSPWVG